MVTAAVRPTFGDTDVILSTTVAVVSLYKLWITRLVVNLCTSQNIYRVAQKSKPLPNVQKIVLNRIIAN